MSEQNIKKSILAKIRNNFIAGIVVLIPIGITLYLTLFLIKISGKIIPKESFSGERSTNPGYRRPPKDFTIPEFDTFDPFSS